MSSVQEMMNSMSVGHRVVLITQGDHEKRNFNWNLAIYDSLGVFKFDKTAPTLDGVVTSAYRELRRGGGV